MKSAVDNLNLRFPGQYYDQESGLHYNYFRDYDPNTGRYIESDPIGIEGSLNTYSYVEANSIRYIDPEGLIAWRGSFDITVSPIRSMGTIILTSDCLSNNQKIKIILNVDAYGPAINLKPSTDIKKMVRPILLSNISGDVVFAGDTSTITPTADYLVGNFSISLATASFGKWGNLSGVKMQLGGEVATDVSIKNGGYGLKAILARGSATLAAPPEKIPCCDNE